MLTKSKCLNSLRNKVFFFYSEDCEGGLSKNNKRNKQDYSDLLGKFVVVGATAGCPIGAVGRQLELIICSNHR